MKENEIVSCRGNSWKKELWNNTCFSNPRNKGGLIEMNMKLNASFGWFISNPGLNGHVIVLNATFLPT